MPSLNPSSISAVTIDLDGTVFHGEKLIAGAADAVTKLERAGLKILFVTNNGAVPTRELEQKILNGGLPIGEGVFTVCQFARKLILAQWKQPRFCSFAGQAIIAELTDRGGIQTESSESCDAVIVGSYLAEEGGAFDYSQACFAMECLRAGAEMFVMSADRCYPTDAGMQIGSGSLAAMLAFASNLSDDRIQYCGKPESSFMSHVAEQLQVDPAQILMVGDSLESDVRGASSVGMQSALVLTGSTTQEALDSAAVQPDFVFDDLRQLAEAF